MDFIKCPECGSEVSQKTATCTNCGCPVAIGKSELIVHGLTQSFLIGGTVKVLLDGQAVAEVRKGGQVTLPIDHTCEMTIKCGINVMQGKKTIYAGRTTEVQVIYNRLTGGFKLEEMD